MVICTAAVLDHHEVDMLGITENWPKDGEGHKVNRGSTFQWFGKGQQRNRTRVASNRGCQGVGFLVSAHVNTCRYCSREHQGHTQ